MRNPRCLLLPWGFAMLMLVGCPAAPLASSYTSAPTGPIQSVAGHTTPSPADVSPLPVTATATAVLRIGPTPQPTTPTMTCVLALQGTVHGAVRQKGHAPGENVYITVIFSGGPIERARVRGGSYSLPLLARRCSDGLHWVPFSLRAVGVSPGIFPTSMDTQVDLDVGDVPDSVPSDKPDCSLVSGSISGRVFIRGVPAPDGTLVSSGGELGMESLEQVTSTHGGRYELSNIGVQCGSQPVHPLIVWLAAEGHVVPLTSLQTTVEQDIRVP